MTAGELTRANQILGDRLGLIPAGNRESGTPAFRFMKLSDLKFPVRTDFEIHEGDGLLATVSPRFEMVLQYPGEEDCWCIARWLPPGWTPGSPDGAFGEFEEPVILSPEEWLERFGKEIGYPSGGSWICIQPLKPGHDPTEKFAQWAADHLDWQGKLSLRETFRMINERRERIDEQHRQDDIAALRECYVNHVPGARGGDYLAFNAPSK